jgi:hypothetical protein
MRVKFCSEILKGRDKLERSYHICEGTILTDLLDIACVCVCGLDSCDLGRGPGACFFEHGNEPSGSVKGRELVD